MEVLEIQAALEKAENLPTPPAVAMRVLELAQQDDVDLDEVANVIEGDPAIVAKLLRVANSPLFGSVREVQSIRQALMVLGLRTVTVMVLSFSLVQKPPGATSFDYDRYWRTAVSSAVAGRILSQKFLPKLRDEAFVAGLLLDIGVLAAKEAWSGEYDSVLRELEQTRETLVHAEREALGTDHTEVGSYLLRSWNVPEILCDAVEYHHRSDELGPDRPEPTRQLTAMVEAAHALGRVFRADLYNPEDPLLEADLRLFHETLRDRFACTNADTRSEIVHELREGLSQAWAAFEIDAGDMSRFSDIQATALELMAKVSLDAALDLDSAEQQATKAEERAQEAEQRNRELAARATTDALTGLSNRYDLDRRLEQEVEAAKREARSFGLLMMDLDHFKAVNDTHGHAAGDQVLVAVGAALKTCQGPGEAIARYGGEEFCVLIPAAGRSELAERGEQIRASVAEIEISLEETTLRPTVSIGAVWIAANAKDWDAEQALQLADEQLYRSKSEGRNRVSLIELEQGSPA